MLSDEERKAINQLKADTSFYNYELKNGNYIYELFKIEVYKKDIDVILNLIEKQSKEIEELKETLKCTQNSWFEDTQKIEEMKKQIDLDNECEIALNNKIMDLEKEIEELKKPKYVINCKTNEITKLTNDFVSKDKIKAKIEKYKKRKQDLLQLPDDCARSISLEDCDEKIAIYEELLEERN